MTTARTPARTVEKTWGREEWWADQPCGEAGGTHRCGYLGKILYIRDGCATSYHYHERKIETLLVREGRARVEMGAVGAASPFAWRAGANQPDGIERDSVIGVGGVVHIPARTLHRFSAVDGDVALIEVSTHEPHDSMRVGPEAARGRMSL